MGSELCFDAEGTIEVVEQVDGDGNKRLAFSKEGAMFRLTYDADDRQVILDLDRFGMKNEDSGGSWSLNVELKLTKVQLICLGDYIEFLRKRAVE